jgi:hypothetical protein
MAKFLLNDFPPEWREVLKRDRLRCVYCDLDGSKEVHAFRQLLYALDILCRPNKAKPS